MTVTIALVFAAAALFAYGGMSMVFGDEKLVARRLKGMTDYEMAQIREAEPVLQSFQERVLVPFGRGVHGLLQRVWPKEYWSRLSARVTIAGRPGGMGAESFFAVKLGTALLLPSLAAALIAFLPWSFGMKLLFLAVLAVLAYLSPNLWLSSVTRSRQDGIRRELPDMLDMLTISVEAGLGFDAALSKYVKNSDGALAREFGRALQEVQAGASRKEALKRLAERADVTPLSSFVSAMVQADVLGMSIANVLRVQSEEMRLRRRQHAERQAQKLPVKMIFPVILFILPATLIVVLGPAMIALMRLFGGNG
ncbi:MAG: type II secretion system F family protein [Coriobacteriia bacterium]|nr:type II secretion system F family protein [Coriobacteriia bacterium]